MEKIIDWVVNRWKLGDLHGLSHWQRVERNAMLLWEPGVNPTVAGLFAYLHDACHHNDDTDILHGLKAGQLVDYLRNTLLKQLSGEEFIQLKITCALHTTTLRVGDITIDTCFDADRLDLDRCGITLIQNEWQPIWGDILRRIWIYFTR